MFAMNEVDNYIESQSVKGIFERMSAEKRRLLFLYFPGLQLLFLICALTLQQYKSVAGLFDVLFAISGNVVIYAWCRIDARERNYELHRHFPFFVIIFGLLTLLYYLFRSRGFEDGLKATGLLIVYLAVLYTSMIVLTFVVILTVISAIHHFAVH
jgi:hypothetical protein